MNSWLVTVVGLEVSPTTASSIILCTGFALSCSPRSQGDLTLYSSCFLTMGQSKPTTRLTAWEPQPLGLNIIANFEIVPAAFHGNLHMRERDRVLLYFLRTTE